MIKGKINAEKARTAAADRLTKKSGSKDPEVLCLWQAAEFLNKEPGRQ
jgi:hypothetical protein